MQWYYVLDGQRHGPVEQAEFEQLVANGSVTSETRVWHKGMRDWQPYAAVAPVAIAAVPAAVGAAVPAAGEEETQVCAVSGKRHPVREMIQYEGQWISAEHRDVFFQRLREGVSQPGVAAVPGQYGYGGFWRRFCAVFVDGIALWFVNQVITFVIFAAAGLHYGFGQPVYRPGQPGPAGKMLMIFVILEIAYVAISLSYDIIFIRKFDATPGKMAMGAKILRTDGSKLSVGRIIGRYFAKILSGLVLAIGYIVAGFDDEKRALHDHLCDTRVVKTRA